MRGQPWRPQHPNQQNAQTSSINWRLTNAPATSPNWHPTAPRQTRPVCQLCGRTGHTTNVCCSCSHNHLKARSNSASIPWVVDSGASHHLTANSQNLQRPDDYTGTDDITMGNGNKIPITHTGHVQINASNKKFHLSNNLCALEIKCNLISVSQFCNDNLTSIEFFPFDFLVKDLITGAPFARGQNKEGLYESPVGRSQCNLSYQSYMAES
ncbi:putative U-box domain-containing protein 9-like [Capsicum annuum]|nr:putative U-box domain-containing protein 9-like [Capsicum annuum]